MDTPGEDSGLEFAEGDEASVEEESLNFGALINDGDNDTDEGIGIGGNLSQHQIIPGAIVPPHIQLQEAHAAFLEQQEQMREMLENNSNSPSIGHGNPSFAGPSGNNADEDADSNLNEYGGPLVPPPENDPNLNEYGGIAGLEQVVFQLDPVGDDNNNDQADDVNNNTTDPQLQQFQQQQLILLQQQRLQAEQLRLQQQRLTQQLVAPNPGQGDPKENGGKKKKKKKKKSRYVDVIGADGKFVKVSRDEVDSKTGALKKLPIQQNGVTDENDSPAVVEIEYVPEKLELSVFDPMYRAFANVFENFRISDSVFKIKTEGEDVKPRPEDLAKGFSKMPKLDDDDPEEKKEEKPKLSKRKLKKLTRLSVAELKQVVPRPDVVEMHDVTARDPKLLIHLKSYRNTVPVPRHWCFKRKYLQGKRGIEKAPFDLPGFIKKTGIMEMRAALAEKEDSKTLKAKMRERVRPKMGKIDIDYQKLHDAFFKWQSKPKMTIHGDLYYEGKEFETRMKDKKPGELSDDLRTSLGMPVGPNANRVPPPWLIAMQRYGPPPSYPHLKVPGLNAPIPDSCSFGYHAGGWGKPPVDEFGRPLYGDVFGITNADGSGLGEDELVDKTLWGQLESDEEPESEEEEEEEEDEKEEEGGEAVEESGLQTPAEGLATPSGFSSIPAGLETPELIELRKRRIEQDMEGGDTPALYTVLPEKRVDRITGSMMASTHVYDMTVAGGGAQLGKEKGGRSGGDQGRVELALDPSELDLDTDAMAARYEQKLKEDQSHLQKEDLSDMVAEHAAKQKSKRKRQIQQQDTKQTKKYKEFKF